MFDAIDSFLRASANNCFGCRDDLDGNIGVIAVEGRPAAKYIRVEYHAHGATVEEALRQLDDELARTRPAEQSSEAVCSAE